MANSAAVRQLALAIPGVEERMCYGTPAFYTRKKIFARLLEDGDSVVIRIDPDHRTTLMNIDPEAFYVTDHYLNHPMLIVRLSRVTKRDLKELLQQAQQFAVG